MFGEAEFVGNIANKNIDEASGMAISHRRNNLLWVLNDSGNDAVIYALSNKGEERGKVALTGVKNIDWEDMASFKWKNTPYLLIADTGDNKGKRKNRTLYIIEEPVVTPNGIFPKTARVRWQIKFQYEDGPRDCEAVTVDISSEQCLVLSKRDNPPQLYTLPLFPPPGQGIVTAKKIARVSTIPQPDADDMIQPYGQNRSQPTALEITQDGEYLIILTYKHAYLYSKKNHRTWMSCLADNPDIIHLPPVGFGLLLQREAMCLSLDERWLYITSEKLPAPLYRLEMMLEPSSPSG
ncbi:hypothetical protein SAMN02746065_11116 [Desulfocicer vacuolatum DSM 3385]|uniref:Esterase-like activity of phytase n=1 Tax=Desulfocicer vacuolatum DSM 3385 TaxID=1121400 RepID=A0A1W2C738_9BACT|nr:hypothetical protein [Desulfocicer vacuolatum]SMC80963.1 hypothetical protein SAMN02746065_11116 [Desulfocicer vacuolatum DSM 3385]